MTTLELRENNPYSLGELLTFGLEDDDVSLQSLPPVIFPHNSDRYYELVLGNNLSEIAHEAYGDSKYWWVIYVANDLFHPFEYEISPGKLIVIPDLARFKFLNP